MFICYYECYKWMKTIGDNQQTVIIQYITV